MNPTKGLIKEAKKMAKKKKTFWVIDDENGLGRSFTNKKEAIGYAEFSDDRTLLYECQVVRKYKLEDSPKLIEIK